jgi:hypothetical protein
LAATFVSAQTCAVSRSYGFTDVDGARPDTWRYIEDVHDHGREAELEDYC